MSIVAGSFWSAEDKIPVKQTKVSIPAENNLNYTPGQTIRINIPPNVEFIQPKESYLRCDVLIDGGGARTKFQLDPDMGGQVLIRDLRVISGGAGGQLLEEYQNYNSLAALRYDYEQNESIRHKRGLTEGTTDFNPANRGTNGQTKSNLTNNKHNPAFDAYADGAAVGEIPAGIVVPTAGLWGTATSSPAGSLGGAKKMKLLIPLHTGIWQNDKIFPALLTEGLRIEILLEDAPRCVKILDSVNPQRMMSTGPLFHSVDGVPNTISAGGRWGVGGSATPATDEIWVRRDNNMVNISDFPLVVGEFFDIVNNQFQKDGPTGTDRVGKRVNYQTSDRATAGVPGSGHNLLQVAQIDFLANVGGAGPAFPGGTYGLVKITLAETATVAVGIVNGDYGQWQIKSAEPYGKTLNAVGVAATARAFVPTYTLSNVEMIVSQVEMPSQYKSKLMSMMKGGGQLNYDFLSHQNYKYSQISSDLVANMRLPLAFSRAKSILSIPTDASVYGAWQQVAGYYSNVTAVTGSFPADSAETAQPALSAANTANYTYVYSHGTSTPATGSNTAAAGAGLARTRHADGGIMSVRSGYTGVWDNLTNYQWFYDGKLNPSRKVECDRVSSVPGTYSQQWAIEAEKGLAMAGIRPLSFRKLHENAFIGRALALQDGVYDTRNRDFNLQCEYSGTAPIKNKLWMNWIAHIRRMVIRGNNLSVEV
jgi:hypothetical protein